MPGEKEDIQLTLSIDRILKNLSYPSSSPSIYRVSDHLRTTSATAYEPTLIAIGPFHREKAHLKKMEHQKLRYLKLLLESRKESSVDRYLKVIGDLEERARECYAEAIPLRREVFVNMLLLDGIFIIEFLRQYDDVDNRNKVNQDDPIFQFGGIVSHLLQDLMLLENQIPLFVVEKLFDLLKNNDQNKFSDLIWPLSSPSEIPKGISFPNAHHLLGLVHCVKCSSFARIISRGPHVDADMENINSATELKEAGIHFNKYEEESWLDIKFKKNKLYIPMFKISDLTESWFRNMIAYEYYFPRNRQKYVTDYAFFFKCLIHSPKDAELLRRYGIIGNWLGGDEMVHNLINQLGTNVQTTDNFTYLDVFDSMNRHCRRRRNRWIAVLRRDYFNSPWKVISFVAAVVLLSVSVVQMIYAILSYGAGNALKR